MCKVYTGYCSTNEIEHGLCACTVDDPLAKARRLSLRTAAQTMLYLSCITLQRYPIFSTRYSVMCKVYTGYCGTSEIEHGLCACTVDNPLAKARGLSLRTGAQIMLYLSHVMTSPVSNRCLFKHLKPTIFVNSIQFVWNLLSS